LDPNNPSSDSSAQSGGNNPGITFQASAEIRGPVIAGNVENLYQSDPRDRAQRIKLLNLVDDGWVTWMLGPIGHPTILDPAPRLALDLVISKRIQAALIDAPSRRIIPHTHEYPGQVLPVETPILDVFVKMGSLLILGGPGSGKTVLLYQLARALITRARQDADQPVPVIVNLSSWSDPGQRLNDWLVEELSRQYGLSPGLSKTWLDQGALVPLLDGLDEVRPEYHIACVNAINNYPFGLSGIVVCCRTATYDSLPTFLALGGRVSLEPITSAQIDAYLTKADKTFMNLGRAFQMHPSLYEVATSPLMLHVMSVVYQHWIPADPGAASVPSVKERREHLLSTYIEVLLHPTGRAIERDYSPPQIRRWLIWLAQHLARNNLSSFLLEQLQPSWLATRRQQWVYLIASRSLTILLIELFVLTYLIAVGGGTFQEAIMRFAGAVPYIFPPALIIGTVVGIITGMHSRPRDAVHTTGKPYKARTGLLSRLDIQISLGVFLTITVPLWGADVWLNSGTSEFMSAMLLLALIFSLPAAVCGISAGFIFGHERPRSSLASDIQPVEALHWSWSKALRGIRSGLGVAVSVLLVFQLIFITFSVETWTLDWTWIIRSAAIMLLPLILPGTLFILLFGGLQRKELVATVRPNEAVWQSARNAGMICLFSGLIGGAVVPIVAIVGSRDYFTSETVIGITLFCILFIAVVGAFAFGGLAVIQHFTLRLILACTGVIPWRYARFLNFAARQLLLQRVGPGYRFIHDLVLERIASEDIAQTATRITPQTVSGVIPDAELAKLGLGQSQQADIDSGTPSHAGTKPMSWRSLVRRKGIAMRGVLIMLALLIIADIALFVFTPDLFYHTGIVYLPRWSPDGHHITFLRHGFHNTEVYIMSNDGSGVERLHKHPLTERNIPRLLWSPDGMRIAYRDWDTTIIDVNTHATVRFIDEVFRGTPAWSPDGTRIAIGGYGDQTFDDVGIHLEKVDSSASGFIDLRSSSSVIDIREHFWYGYRGDGLNLAWSPDGKQLAFSTGGGAIYVVFPEEDHPKVTEMLRVGTQARDLAWSPDGKHLAYVQDDALYRARITQGTSSPPVKVADGVLDYSWAPNSEQIAYSDGTITLVNVDNGSQSKLVRGVHITWSPDSKRIAYSGEEPGSEISIINTDGTQQVKFTHLARQFDPHLP